MPGLDGLTLQSIAGMLADAEESSFEAVVPEGQPRDEATDPFAEDPLFTDDPLFDDVPLFPESPLFEDGSIFGDPSPASDSAGPTTPDGGDPGVGRPRPRDRGPGGRWRPSSFSG